MPWRSGGPFQHISGYDFPSKTPNPARINGGMLIGVSKKIRVLAWEAIMRVRLSWLVYMCLCSLSGAVPLPAQDGAALFKTHCATCHESGDPSRVPSRAVLKQMTPEQILTALEKGAMKVQGSERSRAEKRVLAEFLTDKKFSTEM